MTSFILDFLAISSVISGIFVITAQSPVVAVLYLIAVFVLAACYLMILGVGFVGLSYLIVYVGAVAVLFLFVIMILNVQLSEIVSVGHEYTKNLPLGFIVGTLFLFELLSILPLANFQAGELTLNLLTQANQILLNVDTISTTITNVHLTFITPIADASFISLSQIQVLGLSLYTYGSLWLIITSIILLLAIIGPIALCMRTKNGLVPL